MISRAYSVDVYPQVNFPNMKYFDLTFSFKIYTDKINVIAGPSGCGKTTLLKSLLDLDNSFAIKTPLNLAAESYYISQTDLLIPGSLEDNLFFRELTNVPEKTLSAGFELLRKLGLCNLRERDPNTDLAKVLSGGERRRLSIARAIVSGRRWILLDEPTAGLDHEMERKVFDLLEDYMIQHTFVVVSHADLRRKNKIPYNIINI